MAENFESRTFEQKRATRLRHVNQLRRFSIPKGGDTHLSPPDDQKSEHSSRFHKLIPWSSPLVMSHVEAAIDNCVLGKKNVITWDNVVLSFLESAAVYLRDTEALAEAIQCAHNNQIDKAIDHLERSDAEIAMLAKLWGLDYITICDLPDYSPDEEPTWAGPFCGVFSSSDPDTPFMGIIFKGSNAHPSKEWNVDIARDPIKISGDVLFNAHVSRGIYTCLFTNFLDHGVPFEHIRDHISAHILNFESIKPHIVHVAGHSLGGAYGTLFYAELLRLTAAIPSTKWILGDLYTYGSPRVGQNDFAQAVQQALRPQVGSTWRIVNGKDPVATLPPSPSIVALDPRVFIHLDAAYEIWSVPFVQAKELPSEIGMDPGPAPPSALTVSANFHFHHLQSYWASVEKTAGIV